MANTTCGKLFENASSACNSNEVECSTLGACVSKRNSCPGSVTSRQSCEAFHECMSDVSRLKKTKPKNVSRIYFKKACEYHWTDYGKCRLYNTGLEILTFPTCPGRRIYGKNNDDVNFDCEGHRRLVSKINSNCKKAKADYEMACRGKEGFAYRPILDSDKCEFLTAKVFPADTEHKGSKAVDDGERDRQKSVPPSDEGAGGNGGNGQSTDK